MRRGEEKEEEEEEVVGGPGGKEAGRTGTAAAAPLEANRINVSRIIHAYFRDTRERGNVCTPSAPDRANFNCNVRRR